ncbi:hypothetical protein HDV00_002677 [Rhizophlyctis rosea]|nr:hypothetical protein HDV00_002677 [Rhizophlyctis rosea]
MDVVHDILNTKDKLAYACVLLIAIPEWITFTFAYLSTFINVLRRPEPTTNRKLTSWLMALIFTIRSIYFVYFFSVLPDGMIPDIIYQLQKGFMYMISIWWMLILCGPALCGAICWLVQGVGDRKLESDEKYLTPVVCILPVYNEPLPLLLAGLDSILQSDFPGHLLELHVSFDDAAKSALWQGVLDHFGFLAETEVGRTVMGELKSGAKVFVHRWDHGGKRHTQTHTWHYITDNSDPKYLEDAIIVLTDSDNVMYPNALNNLCYSLKKNPNKIAFAGYMSCMSSGFNFIRWVQDTEYVSNELNRFFELSMGTVNCLPGGFTAIRYTALARVAPVYFAPEGQIDTITLYQMRVLGEDRYLTHLTHKEFPSHSVGFCPFARCKTDPPSTVKSFIQQRRRWLLGSIANEAYMLSTPACWSKFPLLMAYKVVQTSWRSTSFCQMLIVFSAVKAFLNGLGGKEVYIYPASIIVPVVVAWISAALAGFALKRYKVAFMWPLMIATQTILQIAVDLYALATWRRKTWGGPRVGSETEVEEISTDEMETVSRRTSNGTMV